MPIFLFNSCDEEDGILDPSKELDPSYSLDGEGGAGGGSQGEPNAEAGLVTAGEWNDLGNWNFWNNLINGQNYAEMPSHWDMFTNNRFSVFVEKNNTPVVNAKVELIRNGSVVWSSRTDNLGMAEMWCSTFQKEENINMDNFSLKVNDENANINLIAYNDGINTVNISAAPAVPNRVELAFIVDATGSMSDELEFLKEDLKSVIESVKNNNSTLNILTSTVFYRDEGDEYVIRESGFTNDLDETIDFINKQRADGGGDFPEAVHTALETGINELQWSEEAKTRIAFLLLDAPPHYTPEIIDDIHSTLTDAAAKGIKIIPITASGIDKETEFLMRFISILTNGTYVFITNHSGIGNEHLEASVGEYQVEHLNDLMVRLINKYSE